MKHSVKQFTSPVARGVAAVALLATIALAPPVGAASGDRSQTAQAGSRPAQMLMAQAAPAQPPAPTVQAPAKAPAPKASRADRVEARIADLHTKLGITPDQEELWKGVAQVMRDNATTMEALIKARRDKGGSMTALDDLKTYGAIAEAHADGLKKFLPVFETLYNSMSDDQKKNADTIFRRQGHSRPTAKKPANQ